MDKETNNKKCREYYQKKKDQILKQKKEYYKRPEVKAKKKEYHQRPEVKQRHREFNQKQETKQQKKEYHEKSEIKQHSKEYQHQWYLKNKDKKLEKQKQHLKRPEIKAKRKEYYQKPEIKQKVNAWSRTNFKLKYNNDINFKLSRLLRNRLWETLKITKNPKTASIIKLIGCSIPFLKQHLELQFKEGMTWENHGFGNDKWHIDHIIPCAAFDLSKEEEKKKCFHYTNLQPLWQFDNLSKGGKYDD